MHVLMIVTIILNACIVEGTFNVMGGAAAILVRVNVIVILAMGALTAINALMERQAASRRDVLSAIL